MRSLLSATILAFAAMIGCATTGDKASHKKSPPTFSYYHLDRYRWENVGRVLVLPILNESEYTRTGDEVQAALTGELQRLGRFEVIAAPSDNRALLSALVHRAGRFNEAEMIEIGQETRADVVIHGTITHYSPYPRPRMGLILQAVGPREAKVVASVDGLWDSTDHRVAERVRAFYRRKPHEKSPFIRTHAIPPDDSFAEELALDSPALFQRFVCHEAVLVLLDLPVPGIAGKYDGCGPDELPVPDPEIIVDQPLAPKKSKPAGKK